MGLLGFTTEDEKTQNGKTLSPIKQNPIKTNKRWYQKWGWKLTITVVILSSILYYLFAIGVFENTSSKSSKIDDQNEMFCDNDNNNDDTNESTNCSTSHEYVDLGLPSGLKWATCNIGATSPTECGEYFAWGETEPKSEYSDWNSITQDMSYQDLKSNHIINASDNLMLSHDAARVNWGSDWRIPTKEECEELCRKCKWESITTEGKNVYRITGRNGNYIILPACGFIYEQENYSPSDIEYWCATTIGEEGSGAYHLNVYENKPRIYWDGYSSGRPIRAVIDK